MTTATAISCTAPSQDAGIALGVEDLGNGVGRFTTTVSGTIPAGAMVTTQYTADPTAAGGWQQTITNQPATSGSTYTASTPPLAAGTYIVRTYLVDAQGNHLAPYQESTYTSSLAPATSGTWQDELVQGSAKCSDVTPSNQCNGSWGVAFPAIAGCSSGKGPNMNYVINGNPDGQQNQLFGCPGASGYQMWLWLQTEYKNGNIVVNPPGNWRVQFGKPQHFVKANALTNPWQDTNPEDPFVTYQDITSWGQSTGGVYSPPYAGNATNGGIQMACNDYGGYRNNLAIAGDPRNEPSGGISLKVGHAANLLQYEHDFAGNLPTTGNNIVAAAGLVYARIIPDSGAGPVPAGLSISACLGWDGFQGGRCGTPGQGRQIKVTDDWTPITFALVRSGGAMLTGAALQAWLAANLPPFTNP